MGPQIGPSRRDDDDVRDSAGGQRRYLEIINHIVTRVARKTAEGSARRTRRDERHTTGSMDLSGTLINSQLLIMASALPRLPSSSSSFLRQLRGARFRDPRRRRRRRRTIVRGVTMRCQQDRGHIFPKHDH